MTTAENLESVEKRGGRGEATTHFMHIHVLSLSPEYPQFPVTSILLLLHASSTCTFVVICLCLRTLTVGLVEGTAQGRGTEAPDDVSMTPTAGLPTDHRHNGE